MAERSNAQALYGATGGLYFVGGALGPLLLPTIADRLGRRWGIAIVCYHPLQGSRGLTDSVLALHVEYRFCSVHGRKHQYRRIHLLSICSWRKCVHASWCGTGTDAKH